MARRQSQLHLQLGQETLYLVTASAVTLAFIALATIRPDTSEPVVSPPAHEPIPEITIDLEPPLILLRETDGFTFESGRAELTDSFEALLQSKIIPRLLSEADRINANVVEIIGHTDEIPVRSSFSSLDQDLVAFLNGDPLGNSADGLRFSDNVGLGMARAAAVARYLAVDPRMDRFVFYPMSAGQLILLTEDLTTGSEPTPASERRRIEIRLRQRSDIQAFP